jgi:aspartyl-tRNA(Asn)/glutamyl-tRNA(Gln) amidotransferase subunit A
MALCDKSAVILADMLRNREISSRELTESVFDRIDELEGITNAYISLTRDKALEAADLADERLGGDGDIPLLCGIPLAVKDNLCTRGIRTTCAAQILENHIPIFNATVIERAVERDGAVMVGKTNLDQFGMGSSTENSIFGPTKNPIDKDRVPGGSSGGSAAALVAGETVLALGTDTGGSIRLPAAYCGVVGIKPTYGRVSRYGLISYASSLDQIGALARNVADCALLLQSLCGRDPLDTTSADVPVPDFSATLKKGIKGMCLGLPSEFFVEGLDPRIHDRIVDAVRALERQGAEVKEVSLPHTRYAISAYYLIATAEASSNLSRYDGVKYGFRASTGYEDLVGMYEATRNQGFSREVKRRIMLGTYVLSAGYYDAYYLKAQKVRRLVKEDFDRAFSEVDCLITPVSPCLPFRIGEKIDDPLQMYLVDIYTAPINMAGLPGMSVPCGTVEGLPVGLQIIGRPFDEAAVLRVGQAYENIRDESE